jgi:hypothetical protein
MHTIVRPAKPGVWTSTIREEPARVRCKLVLTANVPAGQQLFISSLRIGNVDVVVGSAEDFASFAKEHNVPAGFPVTIIVRNPGPKAATVSMEFVPI